MKSPSTKWCEAQKHTHEVTIFAILLAGALFAAWLVRTDLPHLTIIFLLAATFPAALILVACLQKPQIQVLHITPQKIRIREYTFIAIKRRQTFSLEIHSTSISKIIITRDDGDPHLWILSNSTQTALRITPNDLAGGRPTHKKLCETLTHLFPSSTLESRSLTETHRLIHTTPTTRHLHLDTESSKATPTHPQTLHL